MKTFTVKIKKNEIRTYRMAKYTTSFMLISKAIRRVKRVFKTPKNVKSIGGSKNNG